ncbi:MAG: hypothetical protein OEM15_11945 [Myxococcales bacterium]|nr:hypothetical protein [Myxococcales bacterium]MDH3484486.1 hypothetical protein [Myxococcales bacterium]
MMASRSFVSLRTYALAFAVALSPAVMQQSISCNPATGDATLSSLEVEVLGQDQIWDFSSGQRAYNVWLPLRAHSAIVHAYPTDSDSEVSYNLAEAGTSGYIDYGYFPEGGGYINLVGLLPEGRSTLRINITAPGGARAAYSVDIQVGCSDCDGANECTNDTCDPVAEQCVFLRGITSQDALAIPMACRDNFTQRVWTFPIDLLNVTPDDCIFEGQPFNVGVDPVITIDKAPLNLFASWYCDRGGTLTEVDISVAQVSIDAIAGATCTEQLAELSPVPQTVALDVTLTGTCGFGGSITVNSGVSIPLPHQVLSCTAGTAGSEVQICSTGQVPLSLSATDPPVQTFAHLEIGGGAVWLVYQCNTSSTTNPAPGSENDIGCILANPNPSTPNGNDCATEVGSGDVGETPFPTSDCNWDAGPPVPNQTCTPFGDPTPCAGTCETVPVAVDPATVCATFPVQ